VAHKEADAANEGLDEWCAERRRHSRSRPPVGVPDSRAQGGTGDRATAYEAGAKAAAFRPRKWV